MKKKIKLYNRDGYPIYLEHIGKNFWEIKVEESHKWVLEYVRISWDENRPNDLLFYDPPGGPFLTPGYELKDENDKKFVIESMNRHGLFVLKELDS